ncbi:hypothetical protein [Listeria aquatica]|uniref:hypothetical protein n=1 Tax=Listeria aquatica TaxID=1494960 RepID=UPI0031F54E94
MDNDGVLETIFEREGLHQKGKIGIVGWKMFTSKVNDSRNLFDIPYFIVQAVMNVASYQAEVCNATYLMIGEEGVRTVNNANEIAHYEYGANLASSCMLNAMNRIEIGKKNQNLGKLYQRKGKIIRL